MIVGICPVKDEVDIVGSTVRHMLGQVDKVIMLDNGSTDGTSDVLHELGVQVIDDPGPGHRHAEFMTRLTVVVCEQGAVWVVPFDADELWISTCGGAVTDVCNTSSADVLVARIFDHVPTATDSDEPDPVRRMGWRNMSAGSLQDVAFRPEPGITIIDGAHNVIYPGNRRRAVYSHGRLEVRHFPTRSYGQFESKVRKLDAALAVPGWDRSESTHWQEYVRALHGNHLEELYKQRFWVEDPASAQVVWDPISRWPRPLPLGDVLPVPQR